MQQLILILDINISNEKNLFYTIFILFNIIDLLIIFIIMPIISVHFNNIFFTMFELKCYFIHFNKILK